MTGQPLILRTTDLDAQVLNPGLLWGRGVLLIPPGMSVTHLVPEPDPHTVVFAVLREHRRFRNVRSCTGCGWEPSPVGRTGDPVAMGRRAAQFNRHLTDLIVAAVTGASTPVPSTYGPGPDTLTSPATTKA